MRPSMLVWLVFATAVVVIGCAGGGVTGGGGATNATATVTGSTGTGTGTGTGTATGTGTTGTTATGTTGTTATGTTGTTATGTTGTTTGTTGTTGGGAEFMVFTSNSTTSPNYRIWRMDLDGSNRTQLTFDVGQAGDRHAAISPDGTKIVFTRMPAGSTGRGNIWVMNIDGSGQTQLTNTGIDDDEPCWSPDGTKIAFNRGDADIDVWVMNADGTNQVQLTTDGLNRLAVWSPDGSKIAMNTNRPGDGNEVYVMNPDGSNQTRLTTLTGAGVGYICWARDGKILFSEDNVGIWKMDADGSNQTLIIPMGSFFGMYQMTVSIDGAKIVCEVDIAAVTDRDLIVFNADGSGGTNISNDPNTHDYHPSIRGTP